jgi:hypothetical protein
MLWDHQRDVDTSRPAMTPAYATAMLTWVARREDDEAMMMMHGSVPTMHRPCSRLRQRRCSGSSIIRSWPGNRKDGKDLDHYIQELQEEASHPAHNDRWWRSNNKEFEAGWWPTVRRCEVAQRNDERCSVLRPETIGTASAALHSWQGYMMPHADRTGGDGQQMITE